MTVTVFNIDPDTREMRPYTANIPCPPCATSRDFGANGKVWARIRQHGLTWVEADRYACRKGRHPSEIWPEWQTWAEAELALEETP